MLNEDPYSRASQPSLTGHQAMALLAFGVVLVGSFLPWFRSGNEVVRGFDDLGAYTAVLAVVGGIGVVAARTRGWALLALVSALAIALLSGWAVFDIDGHANRVLAGGTHGQGLVIAFVAGCVALVSAYLHEQTFSRPVKKQTPRPAAVAEPASEELAEQEDWVADDADLVEDDALIDDEDPAFDEDWEEDEEPVEPRVTASRLARRDE